MMADSAAMADQYGHKDKLCAAMSTANPSDPNSLMVTFANFTNTFWGSSFGGNCFYDTTCLTYNQSQWQPTSRAWRWQKCSELAYFQSAPSQNSLRYSIISCLIFSVHFDGFSLLFFLDLQLMRLLIMIELNVLLFLGM